MMDSFGVYPLFNLEDRHLKRRCLLLITVFFILSFSAVLQGQSNFQRGEVLFKQGKLAQAKPNFEAHLKQNSNDKQTLEYLGDIAGYSKEWDKAIFYYEALVKEEPSNANYHYKYGGALGMKALLVNKLIAVSYIDDIKREFELAAQLDPQHIETRWALVEFYIQLPVILGGGEKKAIVYAKELERISPVDGYLAQGHIAEHSKRYKEAAPFFKKAVEVGGSLHTYERLINLYEKDKQFDNALATASEALKKHRINQLNYRIGELVAKSRLQSQYGIERLGQYVENYTNNDEPSKAWAYYRLAQINKNMGEKRLAVNWIDKALKEIPDFKEAQKEKALILAL